MEHAEGNKKIVLKVLSTLLIMYILTGVALFVLAFLLYKMELTEKYCHHWNYSNLCGVGSAWRHYHRKENEDPAFSVGDYYGSGVFPGVADRIGIAEPWADIGYAAYRADTGDVHGSRDDRGNGQLNAE